jgi:hypothetical protein
VRVEIGLPVTLVAGSGASSGNLAFTGELKVEKAQPLFDFTMKFDKLFKGFSEFHFFLLQQIYLKHPSLLNNIDKNGEIYLRAKKLRTTIDPAWVITSLSFAQLKDNITKLPNMNTKMSSAEDVDLKEICVSFAYSDSARTTKEDLLRLISVLELREEDVLESLWDEGAIYV